MVTIHNLKKHFIKLFLKKKYNSNVIVGSKPYSTTKSYKLLFLGSDEIAFSSFRKVNELRKKERNLIERLDLVTTNSKNKTNIIKYAQKENINIITWPLQDLNSTEYDLGLIVAFGHLIKEDLLKKFPLGMVNIHPSLLPRWRGAAPIIHTLLHGDTMTGVTLMKIKADIFDVGEIISQKKVPVSNDVRLPELTEKLSEIGADMLVDCIRTLPTSLINTQPQSSVGVTYEDNREQNSDVDKDVHSDDDLVADSAKKINKNISEVRWSEMTATEVYNLYRAIYGLFPLTTQFQGKQMKLFEAFIQDSEEVEMSNKPVGTVDYCRETDAVRILCKDLRYIYFKSLRIVGKRQISALDFYNGYIKNVPLDKREFIVFRNQ